MARNLGRAILLNANGSYARFISTNSGYLMVEDGSAEEMEDTESGQLVFQLRANGHCRDLESKTPPGIRSAPTLTKSDMERNADAVVRGRQCRSRDKVEAWPHVHDTFAVTIVAGRVFVPDQRLAEKRVKQMRKRGAKQR